MLNIKIITCYRSYWCIKIVYIIIAINKFQSAINFSSEKNCVGIENKQLCLPPFFPNHFIFLCFFFLMLLYFSNFSPSWLLNTTVESESDNDATCVELKTEIFNNNGNVVMNSNGSSSNSNSMNNNSNHRPNSLCSEPEIRWSDIVCVPLMMGN